LRGLRVRWGMPFGLFKKELLTLLRLGLPLALSQFGWIVMRVVDTAMVGRLGAPEIAATSLGGSLVFPFALIGMGTVVGGLEAGVSQSLGRGRRLVANAFFFHGLRLALWFGVGLGILLLPFPFLLETIGYGELLSTLTRPYLLLSILGIFPFVGYSVCRAFLQSHGMGVPVLLGIICANVLNVIGNYLVIFGNFGFPRLGVTGAGLTTTLIRYFLFLFLLMWILKKNKRLGWGLSARQAVRRRAIDGWILRVGWPAGLHLGLAVGMFVATGAIIGLIGTTVLAAHHIAILMLTILFMLPLGFSMAATARVGNAFGAREYDRMRHAGWAALLVCGGGAFVMSLSFVIFPVFRARHKKWRASVWTA